MSPTGRVWMALIRLRPPGAKVSGGNSRGNFIGALMGAKPSLDLTASLATFLRCYAAAIDQHPDAPARGTKSGPATEA
jgi:hypothetical protein